MAFDLNNPFVQSIIQEGTSRGYGPMAIAASLGNAQVENKFNTGGTPGDGGTAYGAMQWRGDRFKSLQDTAASMNVPWTDPKAQAAHWWNEMDGKYGSEGKYGKDLKGASSIEDANDAVVNSLRPAGHNGPDDNEDSLFYKQRKDNSSAILSAMNGGPNPDMPSPNAQNAQGRGFPPGVPSNMFGPKTDAPGGSLGQTLSGIGGSLMSFGNPVGAQAVQTRLNNQRALEKATAANDSWTTDTKNPITAKDGNQYNISTNDKTGERRYLPIDKAHQAQEEPKEPEAPKPTQEKAFHANADLMDSTHNTVSAVNIVRQHLLDGSLDVKWNDRAKAITSNYLGKSQQASVDIKNAEAAINEQIKNILSQEKGSATNVKMVQAMKQILPSGGAFDKVTFMDALNRIADTGNNIYRNAARANSSLLERHPTLAGQLPGPDGNPLDSKGLNNIYGQHIKDFQDFDADFKPKLEPWKQQHFSKGKAPQQSLVDRFNSMFPDK